MTMPKFLSAGLMMISTLRRLMSVTDLRSWRLRFGVFVGLNIVRLSNIPFNQYYVCEGDLVLFCILIGEELHFLMDK